MMRGFSAKWSLWRLSLLVLCAFPFLMFGASKARSQACLPSCTAETSAAENPNWGATDARIIAFLTAEFTFQKTWWVTVFWTKYWEPAFQGMAAQLSAVSMQQAEMFGALIDAKHQLETQQALQRLSARSHKDYHPSNGLCEFGSGVKSLAASERKGEFAALVLARRSADRVLGRRGTLGGTGADSDQNGRIDQFVRKFCDPHDNDNGLATLCKTATPPKREDLNRDVDFMRTLGSPWTLKADFTDGALDGGGDEEAVLALAAHLYNPVLGGRGNTQSADQKTLLDLRARLAKSNVAEASYNALVGMKSAGTAGSQKYLAAIVQDLGVKPDDIKKLLGDNPSYYAQMEVLTKKLYQNPDFYTNLYDTPANVERKGVAIQALSLMQKFDLYKSTLRNEASLSVLLELAVTDLQKKVQNDIRDINEH